MTQVETDPPNTYVLPPGSILLWRTQDAPLQHLVPDGVIDSPNVVWRVTSNWVALVSPDLKATPLPWDADLVTCLVCYESKLDLRQWHHTIKIWSWWHAPENFRKLSTNGGDEDWVALIPRKMGTIAMFHSGTPFGLCDVSKFRLRDGRTLRIGSHA